MCPVSARLPYKVSQLIKPKIKVLWRLWGSHLLQTTLFFFRNSKCLYQDYDKKLLLFSNSSLIYMYLALVSLVYFDGHSAFWRHEHLTNQNFYTCLSPAWYMYHHVRLIYFFEVSLTKHSLYICLFNHDTFKLNTQYSTFS